MKLIYKIFLFFIKIPFILKGGKIGKNSFISPGYDFFGVQLNGVYIENNVLIGRNNTLNIAQKNGQIKINNGTNIARSCNISADKKITIGKKCLIS